MRLTTFLTVICSLLYLHISAQPCATQPDLFPDDTIVVCAGSSYTLSVSPVAGSTYTWSIAGETGSSVMLDRDGRHWIEINDGICTMSDTVVVLFNSFLLSPIVSDLKLCKSQPARPMPVTGQQLKWYSGPLDPTAHAGVPVPSTIDTGRTTYWFSQTIRGCESPRIPMQVVVIDTPYFDLGDAFIIPCGASGVTIQVVDDHESEYLWSTGSTDISIVAPERGFYSLFAQNMCGSRRDTTRAVECEDFCVQFPTVFTPNGDGVHEGYKAAVFCPVSYYRLSIFNRNGERVFYTTDPSAAWDGRHNGKLQPSGVFVFMAEFDDFVLKNRFSRKGTLMLMR